MKGKKVVEPAFRKDYGDLASLRSFCKQGIKELDCRRLTIELFLFEITLLIN
jgi:hypothetical protein